MSLIEEPTSQELLLYFSEYEQFEEKNKNNFKIKLEKKGINFNKSVYKIIWKAYETYTDQKENFDKSSIKANFDNNFLNGEITTRSVLLRYLFIGSVFRKCHYVIALNVRFFFGFFKISIEKFDKASAEIFVH